MANTSSTIKIVFDGATRGIKQAAAETRAAVASVRDESDKFVKAADKVGAGFAAIGKGMLAISAVSSAGIVLAGVAGAAAQLAPAALVLPGVLLGAAAAMVTFKIATAGVGDAISAGLSGDMTAFAEAMAELTPAARGAAKAIVDMRPAIERLKDSVQEAFFDGLAPMLTEVGRVLLPVVHAGLTDIAKQMNVVAKGALKAAASPFFQEDIGIILGNTAGMMREIGSAVGDALSGFVGLGRVGSTYLPRLGEAIGAVAARFKQWVDQGIESGAIERMIDRAIAGFKDLGAILGNLGSIGSSVFSGLGLSLESPLASLRDLTAQLDAFFKTAEAQDALRVLGETFSVVGQVVRDVLLTALRELGPIIVELGPVVQEVAKSLGGALVTALKIAGPLLRELAQYLSDHKEVVAALAPLVLGLVGAFKLLKVAKDVKGWMDEANKGLKLVTDNSKFAKTAVEGVRKVLTSPLGKVTLIVTALDLADDVFFNGQYKAEMGKIIDGIKGEQEDKQRAMTEGWSGWFTQLIATVSLKGGEVIAAVKTWVTNLPTVIGDGLRTARDAVNTWFDGFIGDTQTQLGEMTTSMVTWATELPGKIGSALAGLGESLRVQAVDAWESFRAGAQTKIDEILAELPGLPYRIGFALGELGGTLAAKAIEGWDAFKASAQQKTDEIVADAQALPGKIRDGLLSLAEDLRQKATESWDAFKATTQQKTDELVAWVQGLPARIVEALKSLIPGMSDTGTQGGEGLRRGVETKGNETVGLVSGLPARIGAAISGLIGILHTKAIEAWQSFIDGTRQKTDEAIAYARGIPGRIQTAIGNLSDLLTNAGRQAIDGLLAGLKDGYNKMISFVRGIADGIAANKGPIAYDRKVLTPAGLALMDGLLAGMRTGQGNVLAFASGIASSISGSLGSTVSLGVTAGSVSITDARIAALESAVTRLTTQSPGAPEVRVFIGDQELRGLVRVEVADANRATARDVLSGSGVTY